MIKKSNSIGGKTTLKQIIGFPMRNGSMKLEQHTVQAALQQHIYAGIIGGKKINK